jgi:hypothetical protein
MDFRSCWADRSAEPEAVRTPDNSDIIDALMAVCRARLTKHKEAKQQTEAEQATGEGKGITDRERGWEF